MSWKEFSRGQVQVVVVVVSVPDLVQVVRYGESKNPGSMNPESMNPGSMIQGA